MAQQKGIIKLKGTLDKLCYYQLNGKNIVRRASGPSKERINTDPAFAAVKANNQEFAGAVMLSKSIQKALASVANKFRDSFMHSRLTGTCRKIIQKGNGELGQREVNIKRNPEALLHFNLNKGVTLNQLYTSEVEVSLDEITNKIALNIPISLPANLKKKPKGATHFKLIWVIGMVSPFEWDEKQKNYVALHPNFNGLEKVIPYQPLLTHENHENIRLEIDKPTKMPLEITMIIWLGISYLEEVNNTLIELETPKAMQCIHVH